MAGNIEKAYCWADLPPGQLLALSYPEGYKQHNQQGKELFMVMRRNLYGHPAAARAWQQERNSKLLTVFNKDGWTCASTRMDPCLFTFSDNRGKKAWVLIHTDDCDAAGEDEQILKDIFSKLNSIWSIKHVDAEYMLGITRKITYTQGDQKCIESIECTMTAFIQSIHDSFKQHMINAAVNTPFPEKLRLSKDTVTDEAESAKVIALGYQRAVGMLL